ncbi:MAG: enoyl-[acyl-carrier-protein] reductase FabI [Oceanospirillaceae bacterium]|nr:enoyl-[acyl-carrier-protein] reductase FabI [Oceanospirillaceae bacterium]
MSLKGKRGLVLGIANRHSIAYGCAKVMAEMGAELCITYLNEKSKPYVEPLAEELGAKLLLPCDVSVDGELEAVFHEMEKQWGTLDFAIHSIAWSPLEELHGRLVDSSSAGFSKAMDISCHSFVRMAKQCQRLMPDGGTLLTMSYEGAEKVVDHYNLMGPIKSALDSCARYLASELGEQQIRVHSISPGPMPTRAASGIDHFDELMEDATSRSPLHRLGTLEDIGSLAAFLVSDLAKTQTGNRIFVDAGRHLIG